MDEFHGIGISTLANPVTRNILGKLSHYKLIESRLSEDVDEKQVMSQYLWRLLGTSMIFDNKISAMFFDCGTTTLSLANEFSEYSVNTSGALQQARPEIMFYTNGPWVYLAFSVVGMPAYLCKKIELLPQGPVSNEYGITLGDIAAVPKRNAETFRIDGWVLEEVAEKAVSQIRNDIENTLTKHNGIIFSSSTGYNTLDATGSHHGPWCNSYFEMLFKRAILGSMCPKMILLDGRKWQYSDDEDQQYPVFTNKEWQELVLNSSCAFCITTFKPVKKANISKYFEGLKFKTIERKSKTNDGRELYTLIFTNDLFHDSCLRIALWLKWSRPGCALLPKYQHSVSSHTSQGVRRMLPWKVFAPITIKNLAKRSKFFCGAKNLPEPASTASRLRQAR